MPISTKPLQEEVVETKKDLLTRVGSIALVSSDTPTGQSTIIQPTWRSEAYKVSERTSVDGEAHPEADPIQGYQFSNLEGTNT